MQGLASPQEALSSPTRNLLAQRPPQPHRAKGKAMSRCDFTLANEIPKVPSTNPPLSESDRGGWCLMPLVFWGDGHFWPAQIFRGGDFATLEFSGSRRALLAQSDRMSAGSTLEELWKSGRQGNLCPLEQVRALRDAYTDLPGALPKSGGH